MLDGHGLSSRAENRRTGGIVDGDERNAEGDPQIDLLTGSCGGAR